VPATRPHTHLPTQIIWQPANQTTAPAHINDWLLHPGSLTQRLRQHGEFTVLPQHEWQGLPSITEATLLGMAQPQSAQLREVLLALNGTPVVVARTVLPLTSLAGANATLGRMANRSLGSELFEAPAATRDALWVTQLPTHNPLGPLWGRQNRYLKRGAPLLVAEFFLPIFWQQFAN